MIQKQTLLKHCDFLKDKRSLRRFIYYTVGPFICSVALFYIYAKIVAPPPDEIIRGFLVTVFITPLIAIPYAAYILNLQYELHQTHDVLAQLAREDPLTKLLNRRGFYEKISLRGNNKKYEMQNHLTPESPESIDAIKMKHGALLILDIDNFKCINDKYGHDIGDIILVKLARILTQIIRKNDIVARIGGEEFAIFLHNSDINNILMIFERIRTILGDSPIHNDPEDIIISVSCGVALAYNAAEFNKTYKNADKMLYKAKNTGKDRMYINKNNLNLYKLDHQEYPSALFA